MSRYARLVPLAIATALLLAGCGQGDGDAQAPGSAAQQPANESASRGSRPVAVAEPVYEDGSPEQQKAELEAVLRDNAHDPRVVFDREVTLAFQKLRSEQRICKMNPSDAAREQCSARAKQAYEATKAEAARRRDNAIAAAPPAG